MLLPLITELIKQAVAEALGGVLPGGQSQARPVQQPTSGPATAKGQDRPKGGGKQGAKPPAQPAAEAPRVVRQQQAHGPKQGSNGKGKGSAVSQPTGAGWQLVTRKAKDEGEFQLRAQDWTAPLVAYSSLGSLIDKAKQDEVIKGVIFATKPQLDTARAMLKSSNKPYAMLHIYLDKGDNARRIPGRVGDALRFRTAQVLQVNSASEHLTPDPQGLAAPVKVKSLQTSLVYVRIPKAFASEQTWKEFKGNAAKAAMQWASSHHVQGVDAFGWLEEQLKDQKSTQLFGMLRVPSADIGTLLGVSGQKGIFVEPARRDAISVRLEWLPRTSKQEADEQYLQRALRGATAHGLAVFGNRIAWRHAKVAGEVLPRIWTLSEVPKDWTGHEVTQLLAQGFKDVTVLSHRLHKGTMTFRFRATCLAGDKDLVPLSAQIDDSASPVVLWAAIAPARSFQSQQRRLARGNVPHVPPDRTTSLAAVPVSAQAPPATTQDAAGKELPAAKRSRGSARQIPQALERVPCDLDGNCAFSSVAQGLAWLSAGKGGTQKEFSHVELRARATSHIEKHRSEYESEWDGVLPDGTKDKTFDDYLAAIRQLKQFSSELEIRALARIYNIRVLIVPASDAFTPMVFHAQAKRMLVLWLEDKHLELLRPKGENTTSKDYPEEYWKVTEGPVKGIKVGGSETASSIRSGTVWSAQASQSARAARPNVGSDQEREDLEVPPPPPTGVKRPRYTPQVTCQQHLAQIRYKHCAKHHDGEGLPGPARRKEPYVVPVTGPRHNFSWICEWCNCGVRQAVANAAREQTVARAIRGHLKEAHPKQPRHMHQKARLGVSHSHNRRVQNWNAAVSKCFQKRADLLAAGFESFAKLKILSRVRDWCRRHPKQHTMPQPELKVIFTLATLALQGRDIRTQCAAAYTREWRGLGWQLYLSKPESHSGLHRVAAACRLPSRAVSLPVTVAATRHAALLVEAEQDNRRRPVLFVATYGFAGDLLATNGMVNDLVDACHGFRGPFVMLGDWNQTADEGLLQQHVMTGSVRLLDAWHCAGPCDHTAVAYSLNLFANFTGHLEDALAQGDMALRRRIIRSLRGLRALVPELPSVREGQECDVYGAVQALLEQRVAEEKAAALEGWRLRMEQAEHKQIAWVKERAAQALEASQQPPTLVSSVSAIHPSSVIATHGEEWTKLWTSERLDNKPRPELLRILEALPQRDVWSTCLTISPTCLQASAKTMVGKAPGPDSWAAEHFLQMPDQWWRGFSSLWQCLLNGAEAPKEWRRSLVALLPKKIIATRPIGLLQTAYRIGAKAVSRLLREWTLSWTSSSAFGGAPNFSTADAHFRVHCAFSRGVRNFIVQDLKSFFDCLHLQDVLPILGKLGAPPCLQHLLASVYNGSERLFTSRGFAAPRWASATRGLVQGDPLSPLLALTVGHLWATHVLRGPAKGLMYVDDRLVWVEPSPQQVMHMKAAVQRSQEFDRALQLVCEPSKCAVVTAGASSPFLPLAQQLGYPIQQTLEILGVTLDLQEGNASPLRLAPEKLLWRLRFLQRLPATLPRKIKLLWPLVFASAFWCAGVAAPDSTFLQQLQFETLRVFPKSFTHEVPIFLQHALLGWHTSPFFLRDYTALRRACRFATHRPLWLEDAPLTEGAAPWRVLLPEAAEALQRQGWSALPNGQGIRRVDAQGNSREFLFGQTNLRTLHFWLVEAFVSQGVHKCKRVCATYHRQDSECARGLCLPKPPRHSAFDFTVHRKTFLNSSSLSVHRAAAAAGSSYWYYQAGRKGAPGLGSNLCMCGLKEPSRAHLTWVCPHTSAYRTAAAVDMPTDRASERLFAPPLDCYPPAPDICHDDGARLGAALEQACKTTLTSRVFVAT
ncbi:unnamed protein product, partial [Symbiodinium sp. CCMP2456]